MWGFENMDSPDNWMGKDIYDVVMCCRQRVSRLTKIDRMISDTDDPERKELIRNTVAMVEIRLCKNIGIVVRARAKEVAEYCVRYLYLDGVTEDLIKDNPWLICSAAGVQFDRICMLLDAKDAADNYQGEGI